MAFKVRLYKFDKRLNSTKRPANTDTYEEFDCTLKQSSSMLSPVLNLNLALGKEMDFNYMYIPTFKRYYFIDDIVYSAGVWTWDIYAHVDVLASYYSDIYGSSQYVARASEEYDEDILDNLYLNKAETTVSRVAASVWDSDGLGLVKCTVVGEATSSYMSYFNNAYTAGSFCVGITGNNGTGVTYYAMTYSVFKEFIQKAFALNPSDMSSLDTGVANAIWSPLDYIAFCRWYPNISYPTGTSGTTTIRIGRYAVSITNSAYILNAQNLTEYQISITVPRHPSNSTYKWTDLSPFSDYALYFQPFGYLPLDSTKIYGCTKLYIKWYVDYCTGQAVLKILPDDSGGDNDYLIHTDAMDYGVPIAISAMAYSITNGAIASSAQYIKDAVAGSGMTYTEKYANSNQAVRAVAAVADWTKGTLSSIVSGTGLTNVVEKVADGAASSLGQLQTKGAPGSFLMFNSGNPMIVAWFKDLVGTEDARFGRPLYRKIALSYLVDGYVQCLNASITSFSPVHPSATEYEAIIAYMNSGFFLE